MKALIPLEKFPAVLEEKGAAFKAEYNKRSLADVEANWNDINDGMAEDAVIRKNRILAEMEKEGL